MLKLIKIFSKKCKSDGPILASLFILLRIIQKLKSIFYAKILKAPGLNLGSGCQIFGKKYIRFGRNISVHKNLWLEAVSEYNGLPYSPNISIGDRVKISDRVHITAIHSIEIGDDVLLGSNVYISDHNHGIYNGETNEHSHPAEAPADRKLYSSGSVRIASSVWIGDNVNIVGPAMIGVGAIIASNSVVRGNVADGTIVAGIPARVIKKFNHASHKWEKYV
ncbi:LbetaH domain-containing protein [Janthinobacterium violaceinigrum]|uniref:Acyltransferase n=1 Tax=Janthinobacterium violaceinigrum TaxID=2654252 RepID=A0A6I1ID42_9BURK|nr:acyltransferase [Janthinobacterium violaceinigrum]KAB8065337.1 acyltransferase [Janthinobacterium violaceinigrum]